MGYPKPLFMYFGGLYVKRYANLGGSTTLKFQLIFEIMAEISVFSPWGHGIPSIYSTKLGAPNPLLG